MAHKPVARTQDGSKVAGGKKLSGRTKPEAGRRPRCDLPPAPRCIGFSARRPDETMSAEILAVVQGSALAAAIEAGDLTEQQRHDQHRALALELEQATYQAALAARRYEAVDPFRAFDERMHNVTAPCGASTPWSHRPWGRGAPARTRWPAYMAHPTTVSGPGSKSGSSGPAEVVKSNETVDIGNL